MVRFLPIALLVALTGCARGAPSFEGGDGGPPCSGPGCIQAPEDAGAATDVEGRPPDATEDTAACATLWYTDADGDGHGAVGASGVASCAQPQGTSADNADCDDADSAVHPDAQEVVGDAVDQDCDGAELCYVDGDGDGYRSPGGATVASATLTCTDAGQATRDAPETDCDDADLRLHGGAAEICDGADNNCNGVADEGVDCPCELRDDNGVAYLFCDLGRQWPEARSLCEQYGHALVSIGSATEDEWVRNQLRQFGDGNAWIGANDADVEGQWVWVTGEPMGYTGWRDGEPNNDDGGEHCGAYDVDGSGTGWFDTECDRDFRFVCEARH